ncbi:MAG TPA: cold shock domain-containing protein [Flavobacteriales bacterium]|nr:cold shock domain-containing protein [Flavobacteriales bacterium]
MASSGSFNKRDKEKKRQQKHEEKQRRKEERKANSGGGGLDSMLAYVDENGQLTSTPPDPTKKKKEIALEDIEIGVPRREHEEVSNDRTGRIDFFDTSKGFGFIKEDGTQERYFVHISGLLDEVQANDKVIFETERGPRGMNAVRVRKG